MWSWLYYTRNYKPKCYKKKSVTKRESYKCITAGRKGEKMTDEQNFGSFGCHTSEVRSRGVGNNEQRKVVNVSL